MSLSRTTPHAPRTTSRRRRRRQGIPCPRSGRRDSTRHVSRPVGAEGAKGSLGRVAGDGTPRSAFTLVELLAVIGIMAIMLVIAVPAMKGLGEGSAMRSAVASVRSTLSLARQYAISNNTTVWFLVAGPEDGAYPAGHTDKCLRAFAVYDLKAERYLTEWKYLPAGIVFDYTEDSIQNSAGQDASIFVSASTRTVNFPNSTGAAFARPFPYVQFAADGAANWSKVDTFPRARAAVYLAEGSVAWPGSGVCDYSDSNQYLIQPNAQKRVIIVYSRGGRYEVQDV